MRGTAHVSRSPRRDFLIIFWVIYVAVVVPFSLCFDALLTRDPGLAVCNSVSDWIFILDLVANFREGELSADGKLIRDARRVAARYLRGWFLIDFISSVPPMFVNDGAGSATSAMAAFKCVRLLRIGRRGERDACLV